MQRQKKENNYLWLIFLGHSSNCILSHTPLSPKQEIWFTCVFFLILCSFSPILYSHSTLAEVSFRNKWPGHQLALRDSPEGPREALPWWPMGRAASPGICKPWAILGSCFALQWAEVKLSLTEPRTITFFCQMLMKITASCEESEERHYRDIYTCDECQDDTWADSDVANSRNHKFLFQQRAQGQLPFGRLISLHPVQYFHGYAVPGIWANTVQYWCLQISPLVWSWISSTAPHQKSATTPQWLILCL